MISAIGPEVGRIFLVDDKCPEESGRHVLSTCTDPRLTVLCNEQNLGVGGAVIAGYKAALAAGADVVVKVDADGQIDPRLVPQIVAPIAAGLCDYAKGNRFFYPEDVREMPALRLFGDAVLSFMTKLSSGYWSVFDPTNGFTAIHRRALSLLPLDKIAKGYFFETDMLFRLNTVRAVVVDVPMRAVYGEEVSSLSVRRAAGEFPFSHLRVLAKCVGYMYFLRDFSVASLHLLLGLGLMAFGAVYGGVMWYRSVVYGELATAGTVMLAALPIILGMQLFLDFLSFESVPRIPLSRLAGPEIPDERAASSALPGLRTTALGAAAE